MKALEQLLQEAALSIHNAPDLQALEQCRTQFLGKKGKLTDQLKKIGQLPPEERPAWGEKVNTLKSEIEALIAKATILLKKDYINQQLEKDSLDMSLPGRYQRFGSFHPVTLTRERIASIFTQMGFSIHDGPEIEDDYHNFEALNIPPLHPARAMQDTFYFEDGTLLRTHMSPVQIRVMREHAPPLRMIAMGRVYRRDFDLTHTPMFHQLECLMIDEVVTFADLKGILTLFLQIFFDEEIALRFRPSYFPFTEPSAEVDMGCLRCAGKGCRICKNTGWLEILGCGMVHPNVFRSVGIDYQRYQGFAFGLGIDRLAMLKYGISDLRSLFENDLRFLEHFL